VITGKPNLPMAVVGFSFGLSLLVFSNSNKNAEKIFDKLLSNLNPRAAYITVYALLLKGKSRYMV
jgi:hypothetical protein